VTKRLVDIDDELLGSAKRVLSAATIKETVNRALADAVQAALRRRHIERLAQGQGLDLADPEVMSGAWR
jgi:Arc/MetJ family transcription regulator